MKKTLFVGIPAMFLFLLSCKKLGRDGLPPPTRTGEKTFGCRIDGKAFHNDDFLFTNRYSLSSSYGFNYYTPVTRDSAQPYPSGWRFYVQALNYKKQPLIGVLISADSMVLAENISYPIGSRRGGAASAVVSGLNGAIFGDSTSDQVGGALLFTRVDTAAKIISGAFYFDVIDTFSGDTVHVTDGRFDLSYKPRG